MTIGIPMPNLVTLLQVIDLILEASLGAGTSNTHLLLFVCFLPGLYLKKGGSMPCVCVCVSILQGFRPRNMVDNVIESLLVH
jgi:hypothetical protein